MLRISKYILIFGVAGVGAFLAVHGNDGGGSTPTPVDLTVDPTPNCKLPFNVSYYWLINNDEDTIPEAAILMRVTQVVLAFVGTYSFDEPHNCTDTCTIPDASPAKRNAQTYAEQMKKINPGLKVLLSFGGWNQGHDDANLNCYSTSGCYDDPAKLVSELMSIVNSGNYVDGIDLDYEMSGDLVVDDENTPQGVNFLINMTKQLKAQGTAVSHAPQAYYLTKIEDGIDDAREAYRYYTVVNETREDIDQLFVKYYNNPGYQIGKDSRLIASHYWNVVYSARASFPVLLGMCFIDCEDGYSAWTPDNPTSDVAVELIKETMSRADNFPNCFGGIQPCFGGIGIWSNKYSTKVDASEEGYVREIPKWLDGICNGLDDGHPESKSTTIRPLDDHTESSSAVHLFDLVVLLAIFTLG